MSEAPVPAPIRVWDLPTRLVHWLFVLLVAVSWWTAETGRMEWHRWSGYGLLGLVAFRVYWGFLGASTARFREFVRGPGAIGAYLRGTWAAMPGHNPLGALSVVALLVVLLAQIVLGLFAVDVDGIESGPLSLYVSFEAGRAAAGWHDRSFNVLLVLAGVHILAVLYYAFVRKEKLIGAMVHGRRIFPGGDAKPLQPSTPARFIVGVLMVAVLTWLVARAFQFS